MHVFFLNVHVHILAFSSHIAININGTPPVMEWHVELLLFDPAAPVAERVRSLNFSALNHSIISPL